MAISAIKKEVGVETIAAMLVVMITDLVDFFNVGKTMSDSQVAETIRLLMQEYYYLNIADIKLCFDRIKAGGYGKSYDRIDGQIILMALAEYSAGRATIAEDMSLKKHAEQKTEVERYFIEVDGMKGRAYMVKTDIAGQYTEGTRAEASEFDFTEAMELKIFMSDFKPILEPSNKPDIGLLEWMRKNAPHWIKTTQKAKYLELKDALIEIKADLSLSDEQKSVKVRELLES